MFKNLTVYRLTGWPFTTDQLESMLQTQAFQPVGQLDMESTGWTAPCNDGLLAHSVERRIMLKLTTESRILPGAAVDKIVKEKAAEIEKQQAFKPGRKQMKEIKEQVTDELLPRALAKQSHVRVLIDPVAGFLYVDTASATKADHVFRVLLKSLETLPFVSLRAERSPASAMTSWLELDEAPAGFTVDRDADLRGTEQAKSTVKFRNQTLEVEDLRRHIAAGKQCVALAMTWSDRISFVLTEDLAIKRVAPLDVLKESPAELQNEQDRFDAEILLMAGEYCKLVNDLVEALGGLEQKAAA